MGALVLPCAQLPSCCPDLHAHRALHPFACAGQRHSHCARVQPDHKSGTEGRSGHHTEDRSCRADHYFRHCLALRAAYCMVLRAQDARSRSNINQLGQPWTTTATIARPCSNATSCSWRRQACRCSTACISHRSSTPRSS